MGVAVADWPVDALAVALPGRVEFDLRGAADTAQGDDVALGARVDDEPVETPVVPAAAAGEAGQSAEQPADPQRSGGGAQAHVAVADHPRRHRHEAGLLLAVVAQHLATGAPGQGVEHHQAHAVLLLRLAGGAGADARAEVAFVVVVVKGPDMRQDVEQGLLARIHGGQLHLQTLLLLKRAAPAAALLAFSGRDFPAALILPDDRADRPLQGDDVVLVERLLQHVDQLVVARRTGYVHRVAGKAAGPVRRLGGHAVARVLEVEGLDVGDAALAEVEQLQGVLDGQVAQVEGEAGTRVHACQPAEQGRRLDMEQRRHALVVRHGGVVQARVAAGLQEAGDDRLQAEAFHPAGAGGQLSFPPGGIVRVGRVNPLHLGLEQGPAPVLDVLGEMEQGRLTGTHVAEKVGLVQLPAAHPQFPVEHRPVAPVELAERREHVALLVAGDLAPLLHERPHRGFAEEAEQVVVVEEPLQFPDEADELAAEARPQLDADAHMDVEDGAGLEQFRHNLVVDMVVVDHGELADALDPGVHEQVGGRLAALGVGVVDVVVEGELVPRLRHLQQVMPAQFRLDQPRLAGVGHAEVVGQLELAQFVAPAAHQLLHDLHEHPGGVLLEIRGGGAEHLVAQAAQGDDAVLRLAGLERAEQADDGVGDAQPAGCGHLLDAAGMHVRGHERTERLRPAPPPEDVVDDGEQLVVVGVEKQPRGLSFHGKPLHHPGWSATGAGPAAAVRIGTLPCRPVSVAHPPANSMTFAAAPRFRAIIRPQTALAA